MYNIKELANNGENFLLNVAHSMSQLSWPKSQWTHSTHQCFEFNEKSTLSRFAASDLAVVLDQAIISLLLGIQSNVMDPPIITPDIGNALEGVRGNVMMNVCMRMGIE